MLLFLLRQAICHPALQTTCQLQSLWALKDLIGVNHFHIVLPVFWVEDSTIL